MTVPPGFQPPYAGGPPPPQYLPPDPYYAAFYQRVEAPKPGCVPLRPLNVGDILDGAFAVIRRNPRSTLGLSAVVAVIQSAVQVLIQVTLLSHLPTTNTNTNQPPTLGSAFSQLGSSVSSLIGLLVVGAVLGAVLTGMLTLIVTDDVLGTKAPIGEIWARARPLFWRLLGVSVVLAFLEGVGAVLCLAPGIWLWGIWAVAVPAMMVEKIGLRAALLRSRRLVGGMFWRVWGIRALGYVIAVVVGGIITLPFSALGLAVSGTGLDSLTHGTGGLPTSYVLIAAIGSVISLTVTAPLKSAIDALLYVDLRMRKEGMDIVLQQQFAGRTA